MSKMTSTFSVLPVKQILMEAAHMTVPTPRMGEWRMIEFLRQNGA
jgi:hypothetical protein